jgi:hypothetical protein
VTLYVIELVFTTRPYMRTVCGIRYEWVEEHLQKVAKLDLNRLIGRDVKDIIAPALGVQKEQQESEEKESEISAGECLHDSQNKLTNVFSTCGKVCPKND